MVSPAENSSSDSGVSAVSVSSEAETAAFARKLAGFLQPGDILCLSGELGAGKTTFTRALAAALGSPAAVSSPTFTLLHEYAGGRLPIWHADAYRLSGFQDAETIGLEEIFLQRRGVVIIEWAERIAEALPEDRLDIHIEDTGGDSRRITLTPRGARRINLSYCGSENPC